MKTRPFLLHALSPLHAGTGQAADIIELPIARMKGTGIPFLPGSSIKGVLRDARRSDTDKALAVFGPEKDNAADHAGALIVSDARLLALPVRSIKGTFAWVTSPLLLALAKRDLGETYPGIPNIARCSAQVVADSACVHNGKLYLEDLDVAASNSTEATAWAERLAPMASPGDDIFTKRFVIVDDNTMTFLSETATQVDTRIRIDEQTGTAANGQLWMEESLPPETLLIGLLAADQTRRPKKVSGERFDVMKPDAVLNFALPGEEFHQFGGKATVGRGRCRIIPFTDSGVDNEQT